VTDRLGDHCHAALRPPPKSSSGRRLADPGLDSQIGQKPAANERRATLDLSTFRPARV
jgi:hypothetical protein